jgi:hypothetical protein
LQFVYEKKYNVNISSVEFSKILEDSIKNNNNQTINQWNVDIKKQII